MAKKKTAASEYAKYLGEYVHLYLKNPFMIGVDKESGSPIMIPVIEGYVIDFDEFYVRIGETQETYNRSIPVGDIGMIQIDIDPVFDISLDEEMH